MQGYMMNIMQLPLRECFPTESIPSVLNLFFLLLGNNFDPWARIDPYLIGLKQLGHGE